MYCTGCITRKDYVRACAIEAVEGRMPAADLVLRICKGEGRREKGGEREEY